MPIDQDQVRDDLTKRLELITTRLGRIEKDLQRALEADWQEQAQRATNDEVLEGLEDRGQHEVIQLKAALKRLEDGDYGDCARCGEPIPEGRLRTLPFATLCVGCAAS